MSTQMITNASLNEIRDLLVWSYSHLNMAEILYEAPADKVLFVNIDATFIEVVCIEVNIFTHPTVATINYKAMDKGLGQWFNINIHNHLLTWKLSDKVSCDSFADYDRAMRII